VSGSDFMARSRLLAAFVAIYLIGSVVAVWRLNSRPPPGDRTAIAHQA